MRLLVGCSSAPDQGSGILAYCRELCLALVEDGHELHLAAPAPTSRSWVDESGLRFVATDRSGDPRDEARRLLAYLRRNRVEGVINNDHPVVQGIAPASPCPVVVVGHFQSGAIAALACHRPEWSDHVVAISTDMQREFVARGVPAAKCPLVYNGVRDPGPPRERRAGERELRLVFAGGVNPAKGADLVLKAALGDPAAWPRGAVLLWYGEVAEDVRARLRGALHVVLQGHAPREAFLAALADADALLLPSRAEGCPMVVLEAMSRGVVPIVSDGVGAMRSMVASGVDGYVCSLDRWPERMLEVVRELATRPDLRVRLQQAARARYLRDFRSSATARRLVTLLRTPTVDRRAAPGRFRVLRWHRPVGRDGKKPSLADRLCYRAGVLRDGGEVAP